MTTYYTSKLLCKFEGCTKSSYTAGYCQKHYIRKKKGTLYRNKGIKDNILYLGQDEDNHLYKPVTYRIDENNCWVLTSHSLDKDGYGTLQRNINGIKYKGAHRVSYAYHKGEIQDGMLILHTCNNPSCVNPDHLREGTHRENMQDRLKSGHYYNENHGTAKLSRNKVLEIDRLLKGGLTRKEVSEITMVNKSTIADIDKGRTWTHLTKRNVYKPKKKLRKRVIQLALDGEYVDEWGSISDALAYLDLKSNHISDVCNGKRKSYGGYKWMYKEDYEKYIEEQSIVLTK